MAGAQAFVDAKLKQRKVMLFNKKRHAGCLLATSILEEYDLDREVFETCEIEARQDCTQIENYFQVLCLTDSRSVPQLFIGGKSVGGEAEIPRLHESGKLRRLLALVGAVKGAVDMAQEAQ